MCQNWYEGVWTGIWDIQIVIYELWQADVGPWEPRAHTPCLLRPIYHSLLEFRQGGKRGRHASRVSQLGRQ